MTFDVTPYIQSDVNAIGIVLGDGWYCGKVMVNKRTRNGAYPEVLLQLEITFADGTRRTIVSDASWKASTGPILMSDHYDGELYDTSRELSVWTQPGYDDGAWQTVSTRNIDDKIALTPKPNPPIRKQQTLSPVAVTEPELHQAKTRPRRQRLREAASGNRPLGASVSVPVKRSRLPQGPTILRSPLPCGSPTFVESHRAFFLEILRMGFHCSVVWRKWKCKL